MSCHDAQFSNLLNVSRETYERLEEYVSLLLEWQKKINLVSRETINNVWIRHIWDSAQLSLLIPEKNVSIIDLGSGAGLPGVVLSILGYSKLTLVESNSKKTTFLKTVKRKLGLNYEVAECRIEDLRATQADVVTSRALASLEVLLSYSLNFLKCDTKLIFLKGKDYQSELTEAQKNWLFQVDPKQSITSEEGKVLILSGVKQKT